jgi:hypothetical protein
MTALPDVGGSASWMAMLALEHGRQVATVAASHALVSHSGAEAGASHPASKHGSDGDDARKRSARQRVTKAQLMRDIAAARCEGSLGAVCARTVLRYRAR